MFNLNRIKEWYRRSINKLVLLLLVIVIVSVTSTYIPYLNFIITPGIRILIILLCIYMLFPLSTGTLVAISIGAIAFAFVFTFIELDFVAQMLGDLLYLLLVFIFVNYIKDFMKNKKEL